MKKFCVAVAIVVFPCLFYSQSTDKRPPLVVGIVVDQLRNDFILRYWDRFSDNGFRRLVNNGQYFRNAHYNYIPTYTGPGHSSVYTGTTPRLHGIIGNDWYSRDDQRMVSCVYDSKMEPVGTTHEKGRMSPGKLLCNTIGDELKLFSGGRSKVYSVSLKDRGAVLPAGHMADGAFWIDPAGNFVTSSHYMKALPAWMIEFNGAQHAKNHLKKGWTTLYPIQSYTLSIDDNNPYEHQFSRDHSAFPYDYKKQIDEQKWSSIQYTPYGNTIVKDAAVACLKGESLGRGQFTDMLCVSFSATDVLGHEMGPRSVEMEDMYLRLDLDIAALLSELDGAVGEGNYLLFLTADHGASDVPAYLRDHGVPAGFVYNNDLRRKLRQFAQAQYGDSMIVATVYNEQVYIDEARCAKAGLRMQSVESLICDILMKEPGIAEVYGSSTLKTVSYSGRDRRALVQNGYSHRRSGQVAFVLEPFVLDHGKTGTTHGSAYDYDTHVPLIFYGKPVKKGTSGDYVTVTQIAPTICDILRISFPACSDASPLPVSH